MENPEVCGVEYQQGTLMGYEVKEYLLEKWDRKCTYCGKQDVPLEIEHIDAKSNGGSHRVSNLCLACHHCNQAKGNSCIEVFLKDKPEVLASILKQAKASLKDAAAINATRWKLWETPKATGLPVETGSGGAYEMEPDSFRVAEDPLAGCRMCGRSGDYRCQSLQALARQMRRAWYETGLSYRQVRISQPP
jgi:hypothetical protein